MKMENQIFYGTFKKNRNSDIRVSLGEIEGSIYLDIRMWTVGREDKWYPTSSGVCFHTSSFEGLQQAVNAVAEHLSKEQAAGGSSEP
ncbi:MAG: hypothetical protein KQJ78_15865 [Deltaproteobacteria bacterium]|nr:hypothetical protein [Deltaproteobacteria bacterium]